LVRLADVTLIFCDSVEGLQQLVKVSAAGMEQELNIHVSKTYMVFSREGQGECSAEPQPLVNRAF